MKDTLLPVSICPGCGDKLDCATETFGNSKPEPGDITVCLRCGHRMAFTRGMKLRELTKAERREAAHDLRVQLVEVHRRVVMAKHKH